MNDHHIDAELSALQRRAAKLREILRLRQEVETLQVEVLGNAGLPGLIKIVCGEVLKHFKLSYEQLTSPNRSPQVAIPRMVVFFLVRNVAGCTYESIGEPFGKDHTTVIHGCRRVRDMMDVQPGFREQIELLRATCRNRNQVEEGTAKAQNEP